jgi:hypothetical protein
MNGPQIVLELIRDRKLASGRLRGVFHLVIARKLTRTDGTLLSAGVTWRELSQLLKSLKFERELVKELGTDPDLLAPKDREKFWYAAISLAKVDSPQARREAEELIEFLKPLGIVTISNLPVPTAPSVPSPDLDVVEQIEPATPKRKKK